jgi:putative Mn2+ efflux pump MntP
MGVPEIIVIAAGLSMDAFAVSITLGLAAQKPKLKETILPGVYFGFFQALMPLTGYFAGVYFANKIQELDHWIAFVLLGFIGGKMIKDSFGDESAGQKAEKNPFGFARMLVLAVATSIDALAVGVTFAFFKVDIYRAIMITGTTTFALSMCGVIIGGIFGVRFKSKAEFAGGAVLILIGIKLLAEHLFFR